MNKIIITGPGRSGTTILVKILSLLKLDTGYQNFTAEELEQYIHQKSRGGLENYLENTSENHPTIVKAPQFWNRIPEINKDYGIKRVYVPLRELDQTANSRMRNGNNPGGIWEANNFEEQKAHNSKVVYFQWSQYFAWSKFSVWT